MSACTDPCGGYQATGIPTATGIHWREGGNKVTHLLKDT
jgi:hypothetical protein